MKPLKRVVKCVIPLLLTTFTILPILSGGCYYYSTSGSLPVHIKRIAIPLFQNETLEYGIDEELTDAVIDAFMADNTLTIRDRNYADCIILGRIVEVRDEPFTYDEQENVQSYKFRLFVAIRCEDLRKHRVLWEEEYMEAWGIYLAPGLPEQREEGITMAIEKLATDIVNKTIAGW